jgi:hypothetical protein
MLTSTMTAGFVPIKIITVILIWPSQRVSAAYQGTADPFQDTKL